MSENDKNLLRDNRGLKKNRRKVSVRGSRSSIPWISPSAALQPTLENTDGSVSLLNMMKKMKGLYEDKQDVEKVNISLKEIGMKNTVNFTVFLNSHESLTLFKLSFDQSSPLPVELMTAEDDYFYSDYSKLERDLTRLIKDRVELVKEVSI